MQFANRLTNTARRLLTKYGQPVNVTRLSTTSFDPETGSTVDTTLSYSGVGLPTKYSLYYISQHVVQQGDTLLIFSSTTEPLIGDVFDVSGKEYTALNIQRITAQGISIIYKIQVRQ